MSYITYAGIYIRPTLILELTASREARNVIHPILGNPIPVVTLRRAAPRKGQLSMFFTTHAAALACEDAHGLAEVFEFVDTDRPGNSMRYVVHGSITIKLDDETRARWIVTVGYQAVQL